MAAMSDEQLLTLFNEALQAVSTGQSYTIGDRQLSRANLKDILRVIEWLEKRINRASDTTGGILLVKFEDPA